MSTGQARPSLGFGEELDGFDPAQWAKSKALSPKLAPEDTRQAAEAAGFRSREPVKADPPAAAMSPQQRRRRTGRNVQFNIKARAETIEAFTRIADANGWGFGETLERATELLEREQASR
ncbi:stability/partitioning determinant [Methylorubrum sp. POS3]|uniref:stability/partitioning determinant n=1 Tax=Methylorubrum sp. POS3 TaxID=2998492 RepID=UPI00372BE94A